MEDCRVVLDYAKKQKLTELQTLPGKYQVFDLEKTQPLFAQGEECHGTAVNFFSLDLTKWAVPEQVIDREVAKAYGAEHYNPEQEGKFVHPELVGIAVFGSQPGPRGTWRRITNDLGTFGFIVAWADVIRKKNRIRRKHSRFLIASRLRPCISRSLSTSSLLMPPTWS